MEKIRDSKFEILKVLAIFLIVLSHILPFTQSDSSAYIDLYLVTNNYKIWILQFFKYCGQIGNAIFILCSAYFLIDSKCNIKKILKLVFQTLLYSYLFLIIVMFICNINLNIKDIIRQLMPITFQMNWFVSCYIVFYFITPLLKNSVKDLTKLQLKKILIVFISIYSIFPLIIDHHFEYSNLFGMIMIYYIVYYIKNYRIEFLENKKRCLGLFISAVIILLLFICTINLIGYYSQIGFLQNKALFWCNYAKFPCLFIAITMFYMVMKMKSFTNKTINTISSTSLGIYLISDNYLLRKYLIPQIFERIYYFNRYEQIVIDCIILSVCVFIICFVIELMRKYSIGKVFDKLIDKYYDKTTNKFKKYIK